MGWEGQQRASIYTKGGCRIVVQKILPYMCVMRPTRGSYSWTTAGELVGVDEHSRVFSQYSYAHVPYMNQLNRWRDVPRAREC